MTLAIVVLAAGQGTQMQSKKQKIIHEVGGKLMVLRAFEGVTAVVVLHFADGLGFLHGLWHWWGHFRA